MYEYEMHQYRSAELLRRAEHQRQIRAALRALRAARPAAAQDPTGPQPHMPRPRPNRYTRAA